MGCGAGLTIALSQVAPGYHSTLLKINHANIDEIKTQCKFIKAAI